MIIFIALVIVGFIAMLIYHFVSWGKKLTCTATVVSRRLASARFPTQGSTWDHWVKFALRDGTEIEVITLEAVFQTLSPGQAGVRKENASCPLTERSKRDEFRMEQDAPEDAADPDSGSCGQFRSDSGCPAGH